MGEWATYSLSDFLMFSPETYGRLLQRYNLALWPAQLAALASGLALLLLAREGWPRRAGFALLALAWAMVGWSFHWQRYAQVFLAAPGLALACGLQALLLATVAVRAPGQLQAPAFPRVGLMIIGLAVLAWPLLAPATGRPWSEAEVFGWLPEPTALATLGFLLAVPGPRWVRCGLAVLPALSLLVGLATRWALRQ